jgi:hypothetical protein
MPSSETVFVTPVQMTAGTRLVVVWSEKSVAVLGQRKVSRPPSSDMASDGGGGGIT